MLWTQPCPTSQVQSSLRLVEPASIADKQIERRQLQRGNQTVYIYTLWTLVVMCTGTIGNLAGTFRVQLHHYANNVSCVQQYRWDHSNAHSHNSPAPGVQVTMYIASSTLLLPHCHALGNTSFPYVYTHCTSLHVLPLHSLPPQYALH